MEIERKFIITEEGYEKIKTLIFNGKEIVQIYLSEDLDIRIRKKGEEDYSLTVKGEGDIERIEVVKNISENEFNLLKNIKNYGIINKVRYSFGYNGNCYDIDFYKDITINNRQLIVAEIEFESIEEANNFIKPDFLGLELTYDSRYKNKNLAKIAKGDIYEKALLCDK